MWIRILTGISLLALLAIQSFGQGTSGGPTSDSSAAASSAPAPGFEAADVHPSPPMQEPWLDGPHLEGDRYVIYQATMASLIANAYGIDEGNVVGGPSWLEFNRYDIVARTAATPSNADQKLMLRGLLAERFKLVLHNGTAPMAAYVLKTGKIRMKPSDGTGNSGCDPQPAAPGGPPQIAFSCHNQSMEQLVQLLRNTSGGGYLQKPVVDGTGLNGSYDFELKWTPSGGRDRAGAASVTIFDALDSELGLRLTLETAPRPVMIVDSVDEKPTPNLPGIEKMIPPPPPIEFEVTVITPTKPGEGGRGSIGTGRIDAHGITLKELMSLAWDLNDSNKGAIVNAPPWLDKDRWDIVGKMSSDEAAEASNKPPQADYQEIQHMMRALLADRFHLRAHMEDRSGVAYDLVAVNPKLLPADPESRTRCTEGPGPDGKDPRMADPILNRLVTCQNMTVAQLGVQLQSIADGYIYSSVFDKTGIKGGYNFTLSFSSANNMPGFGGGSPPAGNSPANSSGSAGPLAPDPNGAVSLFDAVRRQLGLKLEKVQRPVPVLVIDSIQESPTPN
jgi:uncharacterized protein (TIGR03435 family)